MTAIIELPDTDTTDLEELWKLLDSESTSWGGYTPQGVYRRLEAGLKSITWRGFGLRDVTIGHTRNGWAAFRWESECGAWTRRHWIVQGRLRQVGAAVEVTDTIVSVKSSAQAKDDRAVWTAFTGGPLNGIIGERLTEVITVNGARMLARGAAVGRFSPSRLTEAEMGEYYDLHVSPYAAWQDGALRIVLLDEDWGRARLRFEGGSPAKINTAKVVLITIGLTLRGRPDTSLPVSDSADIPPMPPAEQEEQEEIVEDDPPRKAVALATVTELKVGDISPVHGLPIAEWEIE